MEAGARVRDEDVILSEVHRTFHEIKENRIIAHFGRFILTLDSPLSYVSK